MSLGTAIFLSSVVLAITLLFAVTKDRWNWRRVSVWLIAIGVAIPLLSIGGLFVYSWYEGRPTPQAVFWDISIGATQSDVKFLKGEPVSVDEDGIWRYDVGSDFKSVYSIRFNDGHVRQVTFLSNEKLFGPYLLGITSGSSYQEIIDRLGQPSNVSVSSDDLRRWLSYPKYNVAFGLQENRVQAYAIYDTKLGPIRFKEEKAEPAVKTAK